MRAFHAAMLGSITLLCAGCGSDQGTDPRDRIQILSVTDDTITGRSGSVDFKIQSSEATARGIRFGGGDHPQASLSADDGAATPAFDVAGVRWTDKSTLSQDQRAQLSRFAASDMAGALRDAAAYLYWKVPDPQHLVHRATALQLYTELAEFYDAGHKDLPQPPGTTRTSCFLDTCQMRSGDAVFNCAAGPGENYDVLPLIDGLPDGCELASGGDTLAVQSHKKDECYGACGAGCHQCKTVDVACAQGEPGAYACYGPSWLPDHYSRLSADRCAKLTRSGQITLTGTQVQVCTTATCCFMHDECQRHDKGWDWVKCQAWGIKNCGPGALWGFVGSNPTKATRIFDAAGNLLKTTDVPPGRGALGTCQGGTWMAPDPVDHEKVHAECPIHHCRHQGNSSKCAPCLPYAGTWTGTIDCPGLAGVCTRKGPPATLSFTISDSIAAEGGTVQLGFVMGTETVTAQATFDTQNCMLTQPFTSTGCPDDSGMGSYNLRDSTCTGYHSLCRTDCVVGESCNCRIQRQ